MVELIKWLKFVQIQKIKTFYKLIQVLPILYINLNQIVRLLNFMLRISFLIRLLKNFSTTVIVKDNKVKNSNNIKIDKTDKILT